MAYTPLTFAYGSQLTSTQMTQLQANFAALGAGDSGAPSIYRAAMDTENLPGLVLLDSQTGSAASSINMVTGFDNTKYMNYILMFDSVFPATAGNTLNMRLSSDGGSSWLSAALYKYTNMHMNSTPSAITAAGADAATAAVISSAMYNTNYGFTGSMLLTPYGGLPSCCWEAEYLETAGTLSTQMRGACKYYAVVNANAIQFYGSASNITGTIRLFGVHK